MDLYHDYHPYGHCSRLGAAVYTNALQERQQNYVTRYAQDIDLLHPDASASFMSTVRGMSYQGKVRLKQ